MRSGASWGAVFVASACLLAPGCSADGTAQTQVVPLPEAASQPAAAAVDGFGDRPAEWAQARRRTREDALFKAEALAAEARIRAAAGALEAAGGPSTTAAPATTAAPSVEASVPAGTTEAQWHALRQCESTQNYTAVSPTGRYRGAYQFSVATWDWVAANHYPQLAGTDPRDADPADQDKMAYKLYEINGWDPWPTCMKRLPA